MIYEDGESIALLGTMWTAFVPESLPSGG